MLCQYNYVCTYKYLKEKMKRAQAKLAYGVKKKKKKKKEKKEKKAMNGADCQIIVKIL